jgi:phosphoribosyl 1,2-cyclic phosphate phosphodiesterase
VSQPPIKITFLGTGTSTGVPMVACPCEVCASTDPKDKRLRSSILVQSPSTTVVIDTTPDFRYQMLRAGIRHLDAVVYTHPHKDHLAGLDDVRGFNFIQRRAMPLYANAMTRESIVREFPYAFADVKFPGLPDLELHDIDKAPFTIGDITFIPIQVWHMKMPVLGFRISDFTYITDANRIDSDEKEKIRGSRQIVLNALRHEKHLSHFSLREALAEVEELAVPQAWFTHISHQLGKHADIEPTLPANRHLAFDGLVLYS